MTLSMKNPASRRTLFAGLIAVACIVTVSVLRAASDDAAAEKKKEKDQADLRKYDRNANGKLDPDEEAARRADVERQNPDNKRNKTKGKR
jgi:hypothetical protein